MNRNTTKETIFRVLIMCGSILLAVPYLRDMLAQPDLFRFIWNFIFIISYLLFAVCVFLFKRYSRSPFIVPFILCGTIALVITIVMTLGFFHISGSYSCLLFSYFSFLMQFLFFLIAVLTEFHIIKSRILAFVFCILSYLSTILYHSIIFQDTIAVQLTADSLFYFGLSIYFWPSNLKSIEKESCESTNLSARLNELKAFYDTGILTDEEYKQKKAEMLKEL